MKRASITQAKNNLGALIDAVKAGSAVLIMDRGRAVARLEPVTGGPQLDQDVRLGRLVRDGIARPGRGPIPEEVLAEQPPSSKRGTSAVTALIHVRRDGR